MWRANDFHLALQLTRFYVPVNAILRAKWSRAGEREWGKRGNKDRCEEGVYQSMSTMAIINHQLCYFLSGDYLGEEGLRDEKGGKRLFNTGKGVRGKCSSILGAIAPQDLETPSATAHCNSHIIK